MFNRISWQWYEQFIETMSFYNASWKQKKRKRQMSINITRIEFKLELENCEIKNNLFWVRERHYIFQNETLHAKIFKLIHNFSFENHVERVITYDRVIKHYYWSRIIITITQYIKTCLHCKRTKHYKNKKQNLFKSLLILERYFQNIFIDFIISLFIHRRNDRDYEHIMITMCKLFKKKNILTWIQWTWELWFKFSWNKYEKTKSIWIS